MITVNSNKIDWREGMTVADVLAEMKYTYAVITVSVDGKFVPQDDYDSFVVEDGCDIMAIHFSQGG
jgi:thiamine biosynthesis protein ThiS